MEPPRSDLNTIRRKKMIEKIENEHFIVEVNSLGAQLNRIYSKDNDTEYLWNGDETYWKKHAPVLFPFVGRLHEGKYEYNGHVYEMTLHGFCQQAEFDVVSNTGDSVTFRIQSDDERRAMYPFEFIFSVTYRLTEHGVDEIAEVKNTGSSEMLYGFGGHPGFNVPLDRGLAFEDYSVVFPEAGKVERRVFTDNHLDAGSYESTDTVVDGKMKLHHDLFGDDAVVLHGTGERAILCSEKGKKSVEVVYKGAPYCGIWHPIKRDAPFVCIEPWWILPGRDGMLVDISKREDFIHLAAGKTNTHVIEMKFN